MLKVHLVASDRDCPTPTPPPPPPPPTPATSLHPCTYLIAFSVNSPQLLHPDSSHCPSPFFLSWLPKKIDKLETCHGLSCLCYRSIDCKHLAISCVYTARFVLIMVGNPEKRFSIADFFNKYRCKHWVTLLRTYFLDKHMNIQHYRCSVQLVLILIRNMNDQNIII